MIHEARARRRVVERLPDLLGELRPLARLPLLLKLECCELLLSRRKSLRLLARRRLLLGRGLDGGEGRARRVCHMFTTSEAQEMKIKFKKFLELDSSL